MEEEEEFYEEEYTDFHSPLFLIKFTFTLEKTENMLIRATDANVVIDDIKQQIESQGGTLNNVEVNLVVENVRGQNEVN